MPSLAELQRGQRAVLRNERKANNRANWELAKYSPEAFKLAVARRDWNLLLDMLHAAVVQGQSWAAIAELQILGVMGPQQLVQINLFSKLGVANEDELTRLLDLGRKAEENLRDATRSVEDYAHDARELLCAALPKMPEQFRTETVELVRRASGE